MDFISDLMFLNQRTYRIRANYMDKQKDVKFEHRSTVVDWMFSVSLLSVLHFCKFRLMRREKTLGNKDTLASVIPDLQRVPPRTEDLPTCRILPGPVPLEDVHQSTDAPVGGNSCHVYRVQG